MKCKSCSFEAKSPRGMITHLNHKVDRMKNDGIRNIIISIIVSIIASILFSVFVVPLIYKPIVPEFNLTVTKSPALEPNRLQTNKNIYWREGYYEYTIQITSLKAKITDATFIIPLNRTIFAYEVGDNAYKCRVLFPKTFSYSAGNDTVMTGRILDFDYSDSNVKFTFGQDSLFLECPDLGMIGYFEMRVYVSSDAEHKQIYNNTIALGYYEGSRGESTAIIPTVTYYE